MGLGGLEVVVTGGGWEGRRGVRVWQKLGIGSKQMLSSPVSLFGFHQSRSWTPYLRTRSPKIKCLSSSGKCTAGIQVFLYSGMSFGNDYHAHLTFALC